MTALDEIQGGEKYLIVTKADANGNKYVVVPSAAVMANRYEHVGKLKTNTEGTPGSTQISAQLRQDYTTFWKNAFADTKYDIKEAEEKDSSYQVTVETQQMQLYTAMEPVYTKNLPII